MSNQYVEVTSLEVLKSIIAVKGPLFTKNFYTNLYTPIEGILDLTEDVYTLKQMTTINGISINSPLIKSQLVKGKTYYIASLSRSDHYFTALYKTSNTAFDCYLKSGCVFATARDAQSYIIALTNYLRT